jgi:phenylalanyl-tRNA synthetase beta chain
MESSEALDPQRCAMVMCRTKGEDWRPAGGFGAVTGKWRERLDIRQEVFVAEIHLDALFALPERDMSFIALPRFPSVSRDLSLIVSTQRSYRELEETVRAVAPDRIASISLFDSYRGGALPAGTVGLSINIVYQHPERTLASEEVSQLQERILESLKSRLGVRLRESSTTGGS